MKLLNKVIGILTIGLVLPAPVCWSQGAVMMGVPDFFPGEASAGLPDIYPRSFDATPVFIERVMEQVMERSPGLPGEDIPGLSGILQPEVSDEEDWALPGTTKGIKDESGAGLLYDPGLFIWEKAKKLMEEFLAYIKPQSVPERQMDRDMGENPDPYREALGESKEKMTDLENHWDEGSDSETERSAYYQREAEKCMARQREKEEQSLFTRADEADGSLDELPVQHRRTERQEGVSHAPDTETVHGQAIPGMVYLSDDPPASKKRRTEGDGQSSDSEGDSSSDSQQGDQTLPSAPALDPPPSYDSVAGQAPPGRPTVYYRSGGTVRGETWPLVLNPVQADAMASSEWAQQFDDPTEVVTASTEPLERFEGDQDVIVEETTKLEIPLNLVGKFGVLSEYNLEIIVDDSGSMKERDTGLSKSPSGFPQLSRMEELKIRLRSVTRLLSLVTKKTITFRRLSNYEHPTVINDLSAEDIELRLNTEIEQLSSGGGTPLISALKQSFEEARTDNGQTIVIIFTDGIPNDSYQRSYYEVYERAEGFRELLKDIRHWKPGAFFPISLMACTDQPECIEWMNKLDRDFENVQVSDDYFSERQEVYDSQGGFFPYTYGMYIAASILGPVDKLLDDLDEEKVLSRQQLRSLLGYQVSESSYQEYRTQASQAQWKKWCRGVYGNKKHPLDRLNRMPLEIGGTTLYRTGSQTGRDEDDTDFEPDSCPCTIL